MEDDHTHSIDRRAFLNPQTDWTATIAAGLCLLLLIAPAKAEEASDKPVDEIVVIGSRAPMRSVLDGMRPVDLLSDADLKQASGEQESGKILRALLPSFNLPESTISDGTDSVRPAALRGLGPDQTLVLINGKRRHPSALVHVNGSYGRGTAGIDFAAIPAAAIGSVEILRDGAAAQYGSDAIAGVINIRLAEFSAGEGNSSFQIGQTYTGDGLQLNFKGASGFLSSGAQGTITIDLSRRNRTNRNGLDGTCQYSADCSDDPREADFNRRSFRIGDAENTNLSLTANFSMKLRNNITRDLTPYFFMLISHRDTESGGFYRTARDSNNNPMVYPDGFLPLINTDIFDISVVSGIKSDLFGFDSDFSISYGLNAFDFGVKNSLNASYAGSNVQTSADSGGFDLSQIIASADFTRQLLIDGRTGIIAFGAEWRQENYKINAGEPYSYLLCANDPLITAPDTQCRDGAAPGIQVFPGFTPDNALDELRNIAALYADGETDIIDDLQIGLAMRYEYYSDAGSSFAINGRARYDFSQRIALRGSIGTGFRAPSLQQVWFNNTSTQFVITDGVEERREVGTFNASHDIAKALNIPELKPEDSLHFATGIVLRPLRSLSLTIDIYQINVEDRIILSGQVSRDDLMEDGDLIGLYEDNNITAAQFFINLTETRTRGIDAVAQWQLPQFYGFDPSFTLSFSYTETKVEGGISVPGRLAEESGLTNILFSSVNRSMIESYVPNFRLDLKHSWQSPLWRFTLGLRHYGSYRITEGDETQRFSPETLFDVEMSRRFLSRFSAALGVRNIFDTTPDRSKISLSRNCTAGEDECYLQSGGVFVYNRRSAPFGFNGAFYYLRLATQF